MDTIIFLEFLLTKNQSINISKKTYHCLVNLYIFFNLLKWLLTTVL